jgi:hypothetical protein
LEVAQVDLKVELALLRHPGSVPPLVDPLDFQESSPLRNDTSTPPASAKSKEAVYTSSPLPARYKNRRAIRAVNPPIEQVPEIISSAINGQPRLSLLGRAQLSSSWAGWASREQTPERELVEETEVLVTLYGEKIEDFEGACGGTEVREPEGSSMPVAHGKTDCIQGEVMGVTEGSTELDGLAEAESPSTRKTQKSTTVEMVHIVPSCTADQEDLIEEIDLSKTSAADLLDDAEISALLDIEEESGKSASIVS